jgi:cullin-4
MLKGECGPGFTEKLETMISDMEMSKQHMSDFLASEHASGSGPQFAVNVLRTDHWPSYAGITINLPESLVRRQEEFERFYKSKEKGRKLVWHSLLGSCLMKAHFTHGTKELSLNMLQGVVLELFNERESMTLEDIMIITGMSQSNAVRTVQSLSTSRYKILVKEPESGDIQGSDIFRFNAGFTDKSYRLKISTVQMKESVRRDSDIRREAAINRDDEVRAAIVRVMKARKQLKHVDLIQQVIDVTKRRGSVDVRTIKKMMEELINKEFIAREGSDQYTYVAE